MKTTLSTNEILCTHILSFVISVTKKAFKSAFILSGQKYQDYLAIHNRSKKYAWNCLMKVDKFIYKDSSCIYHDTS